MKKGVVYSLSVSILLINSFIDISFAQTNAQIHVELVDSVIINEEHDFGWFPFVQKLSTGELICEFSQEPDAHSAEGRWAYKISSDGGKTWSRRNTMGVFYRGEAAYTGPTLKNGNSLMLAGYPFASNTGDYKNLQATSFEIGNKGKKVVYNIDQVKIRLPKPTKTVMSAVGEKKDLAIMVFTGNVIKISKKKWLTLMYGRFQGDNYYRTIVIESKDLLNWEYVSTIASDEEAKASLNDTGEAQTEGFDESNIIKLNNGKLFAIMRRGSNNLIYKSWSVDTGKSWSQPESIGFKGVKPSLVCMKNGLLVVSTGRPGPINLYTSSDQGVSWDKKSTVNGKIYSKTPDSLKRFSTSYTGLIELEDNILFIVYDYIPNASSMWGENPEDQPNDVNSIIGKKYKISLN